MIGLTLAFGNDKVFVGFANGNEVYLVGIVMPVAVITLLWRGLQ